MDRASAALIATDYFTAATLSRRALGAAIGAGAYERAARICLPLQEARRQIRQAATDAGAEGHRFLISHPAEAPEPLRSGCFLLMPPLLGIDGRSVREALDQRRMPSLVLVREPLTRAGRWPIVGVSDAVVRVQVEPAYPVERSPSRACRDDASSPPPVAWFESTLELLGDAAIATALARTQPAAHLAEELLEGVDAVPDHEKLYQRLAEACRRAAKEPRPSLPRERGPRFPAGL